MEAKIRPTRRADGGLSTALLTAFWQSSPAFSGCSPSATVKAPRRTQRWPERKKHARSKP